jgi:stearoyl-CoA desaturase (delta-9 desaturase)
VGRVAALLAFHALALLAPWTFTWAGLLTAAVLFLLTVQLGIGAGYHRMLCHGSFRTGRILRCVFTLLGVLAFQRGPLSWSALHRLHHRHADTDRDPHLARHGFLWAYILWALTDHGNEPTTPQEVRRLTPDLLRDPVFCWLERWFLAVNVFVALGLFLAGWLIDGVGLGISLLVWGFFLRVVYSLHVVLLANSVTHRWGYRNYPSPDNSRNSWWVALLTLGDGWHNNHHRWPRCAAHGHRWFELDPAYWVIRLLEKCGLARAVAHAPGKKPTGQRRIREEMASGAPAFRC